ncbi:18794_t:CDS:10, partial [Racocetra persica]
STSQNEDTNIEDKIGEKSENKDKECITKYFAISPEGDFVVEFEVKGEFKLQVYLIESDGDLITENDKKLPHKKLTPIPTKFESAGKPPLNSFKNFKKARWSIAVSDKLTNTSERLLAISCSGFRDMVRYNDGSSTVMPKEIPKNGHTSEFIINQINDNYSVSFIDYTIKDGGIVKLFPKQDHIINQMTEKDKQTIKESSKNVDEHFLILLKISGIYKYHIDMNKSISNIQKLKYPRRLYKVMINNILFFERSYNLFVERAYNFTYEYIKLCLNRHYFLVDTMDINYIELYDLRTNQLVNTFQRQILIKSILVDIPTSYAISKNSKLLAYVSSSIKGIIKYSIECSLKIAELANIVDLKRYDDQIFINFFYNDEILFIYYLKDEWTVWNIFGSLRDSVKLKNPRFILELPQEEQGDIYDFYKVEKSNSFIFVNEAIFVNEGNNLAIYDNLIIETYLKLLTKNEQDWNQPKEFWWFKHDNKIRNLRDEESELDEYYHMLEPWWPQRMSSLLSKDLGRSQYSFVLDEKKEKLLLIGNHSIQVCFVLDLEKWGHKIIQFEQFLYEDQKLKFNIIIKQTRKIILRFIRLHSTAWRLLDFRFGLMNILIETGDYELVNDILSFGKSIHIPQNFSWSGENNTIRTAFSEYYSNNALENIGWMNTVVDIIPELYESYEKKSEKRKGVIQKLFNNKRNGKEKDDNIYEDVMDSKSESYAYHVQKLFCNPCFCNKPLDLLTFEFLKISPSKLNDLLKVFIPITQLIPHDSELDLQEIDYDKIDNIRMVPLTDFTTTRGSLSYERESKLKRFLKLLIFPSQYISYEDFKEEDCSPFIRLITELIKKDEFEILCENPSMGAVMNWMCQSPTTYEITNGNAVYTMTGEVSDNPFSSIIGAILAVYDWSSISLDTWNFWPLTIISVIGSFFFVMIMQNLIISFMSDAFSDASKDSKRFVYGFQVDLIRDFALLKRSLEFNYLDSKFKDKLRAKYICFYDDPSITKSWNKKSEKMKIKPYPKMPKLRKREFKSWTVEKCEFIWKKEEKDKVALKLTEEEIEESKDQEYRNFEDLEIQKDTESFPYSLINQ